MPALAATVYRDGRGGGGFQGRNGNGKDPCRLKTPQPPPSAPPRAVACDVVAHAWVRVPLDALPELRRKPGPGFDTPLPLSTLKQADEQTVAAVAAVAHAAHRYGLEPASFRAWAVLAAPHYMGRPAMAAAIHRYQGEGAWGASPHLPPHRSLHSPSGTISQLFKIHGPNYGVCGGPGCATEVLAAAAAMIDARRVPGVWVALTAFDPDLPPDRAGAIGPGTVCAALALALTPPRQGGPLAPRAAGDSLRDSPTTIRLRVSGAAAPVRPPTRESAPALDLFALTGVLDALAQEKDVSRAGFVLPLEAGGRVAIERTGRLAEHSHKNGDGAALDARLLSPFPLAEAKR